MEAQNVTRLLLVPSVDLSGATNKELQRQYLPKGDEGKVKQEENADSIFRFANYSDHLLSTTGNDHRYIYHYKMEWMHTTFLVRQKWNVWEGFQFWNPAEFTTKQTQAMACETLYEPDCSTRDDVCLPSISECPDAHSILSELDAVIFQTETNTDSHEDDAIQQ
jgi:hypothetical protein